MAILLLSSVESCGGGLCHHLLEKRRSAQFWKGVHLKLPTKMSSSEAGAMAWSSWRTLQWLVVCPSTPKKEWV